MGTLLELLASPHCTRSSYQLRKNAVKSMFLTVPRFRSIHVGTSPSVKTRRFLNVVKYHKRCVGRSLKRNAGQSLTKRVVKNQRRSVGTFQRKFVLRNQSRIAGRNHRRIVSR